MSLSKKLISSFLIVALLVGVVGVVSRLNNMTTQKNDETSQEIREMVKILNICMIDTLRIAESENIDEYIEVVASIENLRADFKKLKDKNQKIINRLAGYFNDNISDFFAVADRVSSEQKEILLSDDEEVKLERADDIKRDVQLLLSLTDRLGEDEDIIIEELSLENRDMFQRNDIILITIIIVVFGVVLAVSIYTINSISKPINRLVKTTDAIATGDLTVSVQGKERGDEIGSLAKSFSNMVQSLREQESEKYEFITSASHQLRTPASSINFQLEILRDEATKKSQNKELVRGIDNVLESNHNMVLIVNDLFKFLELGEGYRADNKTLVDLNKLVYSITSSYEESLKKKKLILNIDITKDFKINVSELHFKTALINLIDNAITYSNEGGEIYIVARREDDKIYFTIKDSGIGIPKNEQIHVFDKFFRAKNSYLKKTVGTGLGLVITKIIIKGHDGEMNFESRGEDKGTIFKFSIIG